MKSRFTYYLLLASVLTLAACSKDGGDTTPVSPEQKVVNYLVGTGNRYWRLSKVYVNGVQQALTDAQMKYWKVYTINPSVIYGGTFTTYDGFSGTWRVNGATQFSETITNSPAGPVLSSFVLNQISDNLLDCEETNNTTRMTVRYVFNAN
jgi:hypothetical protein